MASVTVWNKGRRTWDVVDANGNKVKLGPSESVEMDEVKALRLIASYPRDLTASKVASPSLDDIKRREQSIRDREAAFAEKEKALAERIARVEEREKALEDKPRRGRPAKAEKEGEEGAD